MREATSSYLALDTSHSTQPRREFFTWLESLTHEDARVLGYDTLYIPDRRTKEDQKESQRASSSSTCSCIVM